MNIYLYFGAPLNETNENSIMMQLLISLIGAFFGFGFSLILYYKQINKDKKIELTAIKQNQRALLNYYKELLRSIRNSFTAQLDIVDRFNQLENWSLNKLPLLERVTTNDFIRLRNIDNRGVFEAWVITFKGIDNILEYKKTNSALDFIEGSILEIYRIYDFNTNEASNIAQEVKFIIEEVSNKLSEIAMNRKNELGENRWKDDLYLFLDSSIKQYNQLLETGASIEKINEEFILSILQTFLKIFPTNPFANEILTLGKKARIKTNEVKLLIHHTVAELATIRVKTQDSVLQIEKVIEKLENIAK